MKTRLIYLSILFLAVTVGMMSCSSGSDDQSKSESSKGKVEVTQMEESSSDAPTNKGVGPITSVTLDDELNIDMAVEGKQIFEDMCTACHRADRKFIGPSPVGILERRTPEWIMNMILDPEKMVVEDEDAKQLLIEFNGSPMANQNLTEEQARAVLEYFRTL